MAEETEKGEKGDVVLTKEELDNIKKFMGESAAKDKEIADLKGLVGALRKTVEEQGGGQPSLEEEMIEAGKTGRMRKTPEGKWVLGWTPRGVYQEPSKQNPAVMLEYIDLIVEGVREPVKVLQTDYHSNYHQKVVVIKEWRDLPDDVKDEGIVSHQAWDDKAGQYIPTGRRVRSRVVTELREADVELDGKIVTVRDRFVNQ